jgi:hypothetical protein
MGQHLEVHEMSRRRGVPPPNIVILGFFPILSKSPLTMALNIATINVKGLRHRNKVTLLSLLFT